MDLKKLSTKELKELKTKLELELLQREKGSMKRIELFYESFRLVLKNNNIKNSPFPVFKKTDMWTLFSNTFKIFDGYITDNCDIQIVEWFTVYNFFFGMVLDSMKYSDVILTPHSILSFSQHLPRIIDTGFPGWVKSGKLGLIINLIIKKEGEYENTIDN